MIKTKRAEESVHLMSFRWSALEALVALLLVGCWVSFYALRIEWVPLVAYPLATACCFYFSSLRRMFEPALFFLVAMITDRLLIFVPVLDTWPLNSLVIAGTTLLALRKMTTTDFKARWDFRFSKNEVLSMVGILLSSLVALVIYFSLFPEVAQSFPLPRMPMESAVALVLVIACINGFAEEFLYRFVLQRAFLRNNSASWTILMQALAFGFLHFQNGFPRGWTGVVLTTLFGLLMGAQYYLTRSMALAWVTHAVTDAAMFAIILFHR